MYQAGIEGILGIKKRGNRLYVNPCIPSDWPEFKVNYQYGSSVYKIHVINASKKQSGVSRLVVNNQDMTVSLNVSPTQGVYIELEPDSKKEHQVKIEM